MMRVLYLEIVLLIVCLGRTVELDSLEEHYCKINAATRHSCEFKSTPASGVCRKNISSISIVMVEQCHNPEKLASTGRH